MQVGEDFRSAAVIRDSMSTRQSFLTVFKLHVLRIKPKMSLMVMAVLILQMIRGS
jgi:hypothetical protein